MHSRPGGNDCRRAPKPAVTVTRYIEILLSHRYLFVVQRTLFDVRKKYMFSPSRVPSSNGYSHGTSSLSSQHVGLIPRILPYRYGSLEQQCCAIEWRWSAELQKIANDHSLRRFKIVAED
uniref:Uncharacterized protein n=1 Tax=Sipha flava TaxID=143950 RepID=A0A2S2R213_9HEMI